MSASELALATRERPAGVGPTVTLGNAAHPHTALYVRFPELPRSGAVNAAFLLLDVSAGAVAGPDVELEVGRAAGPWSGPALTWSAQPGLAPPVARGIARSAPPLPVRIDVTELVSDADPGDGFVLRATEATGPGVTLDTGLDGGTPPRLDVYFAPSQRPRVK